MPAKQQQFAANNRQIAGVLGLKPVAKQLAEIGTWRARKDFPKKQAQGFRVAELKIWHGNFLTAETPRRGEKKTSNVQRPTSNTPELPPQAEPAEGELFEGVGFEATLDVWEDKLKNPGRYEFAPLQLWQLKQLQVHRPHLFRQGAGAEGADGSKNDSGGFTAPEHIDGMDNLGALIMQRFSEFPSLKEVTRQRIQNWKEGIGVVKRTGLLPFPQPTRGNRYHVQSAFDWVEKWIIPDLSKPTGELLSGLSARDEMEQIELREARRREQFSLGNLVSFLDVRGFIQATPLRLANALNRIEEPAGFQKLVVDDLRGLLGNDQRSTSNVQLPTSEPPTLNSQLSTESIITAFGEKLARRCREFNDQLKAEAEEGRKKATADLDKLRDDQMAEEQQD